MKNILLLNIYLYKRFISPLLETVFGKGCRFEPTCSDYASQAIKRHGALKGTKMSVIRVIKCHPFSKASYFDPVS